MYVQKRTVTIYIGSAHSRFEFNLPGGESWRLKYIQPMSQKETELLISSPNSVNNIFKEIVLILSSSNYLSQMSTIRTKMD